MYTRAAILVRDSISILLPFVMANTRSRSPVAREVESDIRTMLRMRDQRSPGESKRRALAQIAELKKQLEVKDNLIGDLRAKVMDKNEVIVDLKVQLTEAKRDRRLESRISCRRL